jgi:hypothetical protein
MSFSVSSLLDPSIAVLIPVFMVCDGGDVVVSWFHLVSFRFILLYSFHIFFIFIFFSFGWFHGFIRESEAVPEFLTGIQIDMLPLFGCVTSFIIQSHVANCTTPTLRSHIVTFYKACRCRCSCCQTNHVLPARVAAPSSILRGTVHHRKHVAALRLSPAGHHVPVPSLLCSRPAAAPGISWDLHTGDILQTGTY